MSRAIPSLLVVALVASVSGGCAANPAAQAVAAALAAVASEPVAPAVNLATPQSKSKAITVAQRQARLHGWAGIQVLGASFENGRWAVSLQRLPKMPGGAATVNVSADGELLDFEPDA